jgi:hypothetical protein
VKDARKRAKDRAWEWFSKYVRLRDCLKTTGTPERGKCYTCDVLKPLEELQAGHLVQGRYDSVLFQERGVHAQCIPCNNYKNGAIDVYYMLMVKEHGKEYVEELVMEKFKPVKYHENDYREIADDYRQRYNDMMQAYKEGKYAPAK